MTRFSSDFDRLAEIEMQASHDAKASGNPDLVLSHWVAAKRFLLLAEESRAAERDLMKMSQEVEG